MFQRICMLVFNAFLMARYLRGAVQSWVGLLTRKCGKYLHRLCAFSTQSVTTEVNNKS